MVVLPSANKIALKSESKINAYNKSNLRYEYTFSNSKSTRNSNINSSENSIKLGHQRSRYFSTSATCFSNFNQNFKSSKTGTSFWTSPEIKEKIYRFTISVAFEPKDRSDDNSAKSVDPDEDDSSDGELIRKMKKSHLHNNSLSLTGEDNYIFGISGDGVIAGVADGVGGWSEQGYDSSAISRELCHSITDVYLSNPSTSPIIILEEAFDSVKKNGKVDVGSTTVCFGSFSPDGTLSAVNLGDSWFGVFRQDNPGTPGDKFKCVYESKEQTYYFNAPYQLSIIPEHILEAGRKRNAKYLINQPSDADVYNFKLERGDVVMFSTDGVGDNVCPDDIGIFITDELAAAQDKLIKSKQESAKTNGIFEKPEELGDLNKKLVRGVKKLSLNTNFKSVFSQKLSEMTGQDYVGGKPDDITSVFIYVD
ncbi:hydrolase activity protein [[Candida] boidinii]|nr:hydrolase activity protein [[Candida] boidinii]